MKESLLVYTRIGDRIAGDIGVNVAWIFVRKDVQGCLEQGRTKRVESRIVAAIKFTAKYGLT